MQGYKTIVDPSEGEYKEKGSRFIAFVFPAKNEEECLACVEKVKKDHHKARHHCYAYRTDLNQKIFRTNDDGEPSGTAGRPILGQIDRFGLFNVIVVVVRYFGGTKLGASGLIRAYKTAAELALQNATFRQVDVKDLYTLTFDYAHMGTFMDILKNLDIEFLDQSFDKEAQIKIAVPKRLGTHWQVLLKANAAGITEEEAEETEKVKGLEWEYLGTK